MSWTSLPQELQLLTIDHLEREDWKNLRLTNKTNATLVTPNLFQTIHLTPNTRSFDRARGIATSPDLSKHVKALVYHVGVLEDVHNGFETFRTDIMRLHHPVGSYDDIVKDILWKYHCFLEEMDGQRDFETRDELDELRVVCQDLVVLESLTLILDEDDPFSPPQDFIGRRTGVQSACSADGPHFSSLIRAAAGQRLNTIRSWSTSWRCLSQMQSDVLENLDLTNMRDLALGLFNSEFLEMELDDQGDALHGLDAFLKHSISSESYTLQLDFDEIPFEALGDDLRPISDVVFKHHWPFLRQLALQGIAATEDDIIQFLNRHRETLTKLHLDDVEVLDEYDCDVDSNTISHPGSVVVLFRRISESLSLDSATITGNFTNRRDESWYVNLEDESQSSLRRDIELWLSKRAPPPFPKELLHRDLTIAFQSIDDSAADRDADPEKEARSAIAEEYSDGSWVWDLDLVM